LKPGQKQKKVRKKGVRLLRTTPSHTEPEAGGKTAGTRKATRGERTAEGRRKGALGA